jgi:hypothetical protein
MKKTLNTLSTLILAAAVVVTVGCTKTKSEENEAPGLGSATIKGILRAQTDTTQHKKATPGTPYYLPVSGVTVTGTYNTKNLALYPSTGTYPDASVTSTTDASGLYTLTIPCRAKAVSVSITYSDFVQKFNGANNGGSSDSTLTIFSGSGLATTQSVTQGQTVVIDQQY